MSVLFDTMALRYVHRGACLRLKKASWDSLRRIFAGLFLSIILRTFPF